MRFMIFGLILSMAAICGCGSKHTVTASEHANAQSKERNPMAVQVSDTELKQLKIGKPSIQPVAKTMRAPGRIEADASRMTRVGVPVTGRIVKIEALEGQHVRVGEVLATIHSTQLSDAEFAFLKAYSQHELQKRAVDRAEKLLEADVIGTAELQKRRTELEEGDAELAASRSELKILGIPPSTVERVTQTGNIEPSANIVSEINGTILERKATMGQIVQQADPVFVVADLSMVWLVADVPEEAAGELAVGKSVEAHVSAYPDISIKGKLSFVSSIVNPETRTVQVRMNLPNSQHRYKPDMLATMTLENPPMPQKVVPLGAIVRNGDDDSIFVRTGEKAFRLVPVQLGEQSGDKRVLLSGIEPDQNIVLDGAFNLNNERIRLAQLGEQ